MTAGTARRGQGRSSVHVMAGLLAVAGLMSAAYLWLGRAAPASGSGPMQLLTIAVNTGYAGSCAVIVAQESGYFTQEGLQVTLLPHTSGKAALDATLQGLADLSISADIPIMFAALREQPLSLLATIFSTDKDYAAVARRDRGISTPDSLRGKRIGVTLGTSGHFVLDAFLNRQKLAVRDVTVVDLKPEELAPALLRGELDAALTWEPYVGLMKEQLGSNGVAFQAHGVYEASYNLSGTRDYVRVHRDTVRKALRALVSGGRFCKEVPDAAREITARAMKTDAAKLQPFWPGYRFDTALDQSLLLAFEDETRWAIKNGLTDRREMPNYLDFVDLDGLLAVLPAAVTIIH